MLKRFLLGRGFNRLEEITSKGVRHVGGSTVGGALIANGLATSDEVQTAVGALLTLAGFGLSVLRTFLSDKL